jgi:hypothetical protein
MEKANIEYGSKFCGECDLFKFYPLDDGYSCLKYDEQLPVSMMEDPMRCRQCIEDEG